MLVRVLLPQVITMQIAHSGAAKWRYASSAPARRASQLGPREMRKRAYREDRAAVGRLLLARAAGVVEASWRCWASWQRQ